MRNLNFPALHATKHATGASRSRSTCKVSFAKKEDYEWLTSDEEEEDFRYPCSTHKVSVAKKDDYEGTTTDEEEEESRYLEHVKSLQAAIKTEKAKAKGRAKARRAERRQARTKVIKKLTDELEQLRSLRLAEGSYNAAHEDDTAHEEEHGEAISVEGGMHVVKTKREEYDETLDDEGSNEGFRKDVPAGYEEDNGEDDDDQDDQEISVEGGVQIARGEDAETIDGDDSDEGVQKDLEIPDEDTVWEDTEATERKRKRLEREGHRDIDLSHLWNTLGEKANISSFVIYADGEEGKSWKETVGNDFLVQNAEYQHLKKLVRLKGQSVPGSLAEDKLYKARLLGLRSSTGSGLRSSTGSETEKPVRIGHVQWYCPARDYANRLARQKRIRLSSARTEPYRERDLALMRGDDFINIDTILGRVDIYRSDDCTEQQHQNPLTWICMQEFSK